MNTKSAILLKTVHRALPCRLIIIMMMMIIVVQFSSRAVETHLFVNENVIKEEFLP
jgi:hypothetical protein